MARKTVVRSGFMDTALDEAAVAGRMDEVPVGAVIVDAGGNIVAKAHNRVVTDSDPTAHAEMLAIRAAARKLGSERLTGCDIYVTLEPCAMCAQAMALARLRRLYYGAPDEKGGGVRHGSRVFDQPTCHHRPEVYDGIGEEPSRDLLKRFFRERRTQP